jgi:hypothetical protein
MRRTLGINSRKTLRRRHSAMEHTDTVYRIVGSVIEIMRIRHGAESRN